MYAFLIILASILLILLITVKNTYNVNTKIVEKAITHMWNLKVKKSFNFSIYLKILITHF